MTLFLDYRTEAPPILRDFLVYHETIQGHSRRTVDEYYLDLRNFYSHIPNEQVAEFQKKRAAQMPCDDVVVYCIGCVRSMTVGGKRPLYMPDLVLARHTKPMDNTLDEYHN